MFALKENIIPHFEIMSSIDHGADINWKVWACESIVKKAMESTAFQIDSSEAKILRGAQINLGLDEEDFHLVYCLDLHVIQMSDYGRQELIDYLADLTGKYFWFAMKKLGKM